MKLFIRIWPFLFLFIIWFFFASPYFLKGKMPYSATYQVNTFAPWDAYPQFHSPVKNGAMPDVTTQIYPWKHFTIDAWKQGQIPLWNPYSFGGTPHLANYQSAVLSPLNFLFFVLPFRDAWSVLILLQPLLAGIFLYLFIRTLKVSISASVFSAVSFMFCGFITVWMDYGTLAYAILFLPLSLFAIEKFHQKGQILFLILLSLTVPLSFFSGHFQISLYFFSTIIFYIIFKYFQTRKLQTTIYILLTIICGLLLSLFQILPSLEFYTQALRSTLFQKGEVIPWIYIPTLLAPDFFGNPVTRNDWFGHYAEWNAYIGVLPCMLSFYALKKRDASVYFFFFLGLLATLIAFPTPFLDAIIALRIPVLATSAASRIIILFSFSFVLLAGFGFDALLIDIQKNNKRSIFIWLGFFFFTFACLWGIVLAKIFFPLEKISIAKQNILLPSALFMGIFFCISLALFLKKITKDHIVSVTSLVFLLIISFDMLRFVTKWQAFDSKQLAFADAPVTRFFPKIAGYQRIIGNFGAETAVYYQLPSLEGYDALYIDRYGEFITSLSDGKVRHADRSVVIFPKDGRYTPKAINLLNVGYIVHKVSDDFTGWTFPYWNYPGSQFQNIYDDGMYRVYKNTAVFPRAFLVNSYTVKKNPQDIFSTMFAKNFDLRHEIVLEKDPGIKSMSKGDPGTVQIIQFTPDRIVIDIHANLGGLLFTSDPYYPGWHAAIDGKLTEIFRADFAFRAIKIPSGNHVIIFSYTPKFL